MNPTRIFKSVKSNISYPKIEENAERIKLLEYCLVGGIILYIPKIFYLYALGLIHSLLLSIFFVITCYFISIINRRGHYLMARNLIFIAINLLFVTASYIEGNSTGVYLIFIPLFISFSILGRMNDNKIHILLLILLTILSLIISMFLCPRTSSFQNISESVTRIMFVSNFFIAIALTIIFSYLIYKVNTKKETELLKAKELAEESAKSRSVFVSSMSHELRTPLNGIIGATNLLMHEPASLSQKKYYDILKDTSDHMLHLINQVLDFSKISEKKINLDRNTFNVKHVVSKLCRVLQAQNTQEEVNFNYQIDDELDLDVISDDLRLKQILLNILSNAFKFTKKGSVNLIVRMIARHDNNLQIKFTITDTGVGIPEDKLKDIFESFEQADTSTTRNFGGTGLGLSISKQLVSLFGSALVVQSQEGKGSTFSFEINVAVADAKTNVSENFTVKNDLRRIKILVAEDNKVNMLVLVTFLKKWNVDHTEVVNGALALDKYNANKYDLILMDLEMPHMDGYTAISEIRKKDKNIPVLAFTAALYDNMAQDLQEKGFTGYIHKPFNPKDLFEKIKKHALVD